MAPIRTAVRLHEVLCMLMPGKRLYAFQKARVDLYVLFSPRVGESPHQMFSLKWRTSVARGFIIVWRGGWGVGEGRRKGF